MALPPFQVHSVLGDSMASCCFLGHWGSEPECRRPQTGPVWGSAGTSLHTRSHQRREAPVTGVWPVLT